MEERRTQEKRHNNGIWKARTEKIRLKYAVFAFAYLSYIAFYVNFRLIFSFFFCVEGYRRVESDTATLTLGSIFLFICYHFNPFLWIDNCLCIGRCPDNEIHTSSLSQSCCIIIKLYKNV